jgi:hypothetical protein
VIQKIKIDGFRALKGISLEEVKNVNIIVGPNASGKTSLLEALYLVMGNSLENSVKLKRWRGVIEATPYIPIGTDFHLWEDLFFDKTRPAFSIEINDSTIGRRRLEVTLSADQAITLPFEDGIKEDKLPTLPISFVWYIGDQRYECPVEITKDGYKLGRVPGFISSVFMATKGGGPTENANRFSTLSKQNREHEVLDGMRTMYPYIEKLTVETEVGDSACVYALVKGHEKKLPLPVVSEGINKYLSLLLAVSYAKGGVVLIDEMEGGFYYGTLERLWEGILAFATKFDTQIFVATHSMESLLALKPSIEKDVDRFALLRMNRNERTGVCGVDQISGKRVAAALEEGFEIR